MKKVVIPGELITKQKKRAGYNSYKMDEGIYSSVMGLADDTEEVVKVVPLEGKYIPKVGDQVIGIVTEENSVGYEIDLNSIFDSFIPKRMLRARLRPGTLVQAKIMKVNSVNEADLDYIKGLPEGDFVKIGPTKVPRVIGKGASMINMIKDYVGGTISVGKNGFIWVKGADMPLLKKALNKIEQEAHTSNLTNRVKELLEEEKKSKKVNE